MQTFDHKHGRIYIHCVFVELILNWLSIHCKHTSKQALGAQLVTIIRKWTNFHRQNCSVHSFGCATLFMALSIPYCFKLPLYFFPWKLADHRLTTEHHIHIYKFVVVSILGESLSLAIEARINNIKLLAMAWALRFFDIVVGKCTAFICSVSGFILIHLVVYICHTNAIILFTLLTKPTPCFCVFVYFHDWLEITADFFSWLQKGLLFHVRPGRWVLAFGTFHLLLAALSH